MLHRVLYQHFLHSIMCFFSFDYCMILIESALHLFLTQFKHKMQHVTNASDWDILIVGFFSSKLHVAANLHGFLHLLTHHFRNCWTSWWWWCGHNIFGLHIYVSCLFMFSWFNLLCGNPWSQTQLQYQLMFLVSTTLTNKAK